LETKKNSGRQYADASLFDTYLDVQEFLGKNWRAVVNRVTGTIERSSEHFNTDGHAQDVASELYVSV
jgi:hypothetical protein